MKKVIDTKANLNSLTIRLQVEDEYKAIPIIADKLHSIGARVSAIRQAEPTLEDIFVKLTREA